MKFMKEMAPYWKAVTAFIVGCLQVLALYVTLSADGKITPEDFNAIIATVILALGGTGAVYQVPNKKLK